LGNSHVREMDACIVSKYPKIQTFTISVPRKIEAIMLRYHDSLPQIRRLNPDFIILHYGHNELAYHSQLNCLPKDSTQVTALTLQTAATLRNNHPNATLILSAVFPRTFTSSCSMTYLNLCHYNKTAKRHGKRVGSQAESLNIRTKLNMTMWKCISQVEENTTRYLKDGLHLTTAAKALITSEWIDNIRRETGFYVDEDDLHDDLQDTLS
jgi:lysophospholipase L1-like esterase